MAERRTKGGRKDWTDAAKGRVQRVLFDRRTDTMPHHVRHPWLEEGEKILWDAIANRGPDDTRQVGGILYLTDRRLYFKPHILERFAEEPVWEAPVGRVRLSIGPGPWSPHVPVLRDIAARYHLEVTEGDGSVEDFWLPHLGEALERLADPEDRRAT
jgi:hypothetical protein